MIIKNFVKIFYSEQKEEIREVYSSNFEDFQIPKNALAIDTYSKAYETTSFKGKKLCRETTIGFQHYIIGKMLSLEEITNRYGESSNLYRYVSEGGCIVLNANNTPVCVYGNDKVLSPEVFAEAEG